MAVLDSLIRERARKAVRLLAGRAIVRAAYLFGSQVEGKAREFSDIDIGVFVERLEELSLPERIEAAVMVQEELGDDLEIHFLSAQALSQADPASFAAYILRHGIKISEAESS
jgi:predicted nucleotidyltransferase